MKITDTERLVIEGLLKVTYETWHALDNSEDRGDIHIIDNDEYQSVSKALDVLEELPDDQPGYTMAAAAKARWALRRLLD